VPTGTSSLASLPVPMHLEVPSRSSQRLGPRCLRRIPLALKDEVLDHILKQDAAGWHMLLATAHVQMRRPVPMPMELQQLPLFPSSDFAEAVLVPPRADRPVTVVLNRLDRHADLEVQCALRDPVIPVDGQTKGAAGAFRTHRHLGCAKNVECFLDDSGEVTCRPVRSARQGDLLSDGEGKQSNQISDRPLIRPITEITSLKGVEELHSAQPHPFGGAPLKECMSFLDGEHIDGLELCGRGHPRHLPASRIPGAHLRTTLRHRGHAHPQGSPGQRA